MNCRSIPRRPLAAVLARVAVLAACAALSWAGAAPAGNDDLALLETFIKFKQSAIVAAGGAQADDPALRHRRLIQELEAAGLEVPRAVRDGVSLDAAQMAGCMLPAFSPGWRSRVGESVGRSAPPDSASRAAATAIVPVDTASEAQEPRVEPLLATVGSVESGASPVWAAAPGTSNTADTASTAASTGAETLASSSGSGAQTPGGGGRDAPTSYVLGPGDVLDLVYLDKEIAPSGQENAAATATVNLEGKVVLPLLGVVQAAGFTVDQFRGRVLALYRRYIQRPRVTVFVKEYHSKRVYLLGEVNHTGVITLTGERLSLFELLAMAGGASEQADRQHIIILRGSRKFVVDLQRELENPQVSEQFFVQPGDRIIVPRPMHRITVLGGVNHAGEFPFEPGMTLLQAIAQAGSFNENARKDRIRVIRKRTGNKVDVRTPSAMTQTLSVDVNQILRGKRQDLALSPDDTVFVFEY